MVYNKQKRKQNVGMHLNKLFVTIRSLYFDAENDKQVTQNMVLRQPTKATSTSDILLTTKCFVSQLNTVINYQSVCFIVAKFVECLINQ